MRQLGSLHTASAGSEFDKFLEPDENNAMEDTLPPSTQLGYEDPQATKQRQVVMGKMLGRHKNRVAVRP